MATQKEKPTCFIISPIGKEKSETRKRSDDLRSLIIEDSLESFDFKVIRADDGNNPVSITNEIISFIQKSDLCIVDLTDKNPNVMYEFGRRQETGKPYILLAQKGTELPFDLAMIRTIFYDLNDPFNIKDCKKAIKKYITTIINDGFQRESSGESLSSIAEQLRRIERRMDSLTSSTSMNTSPASMIYDDVDLTPIQQYRLAIQEKNIPVIEGLLPYFEKTKQKDLFYDQYLEVAAGVGSNMALDRLLNDIEYINSLTEERKVEAISYISIGLQQTGRQEEGLKALSPIIDKCLVDFKDDSHKATVLNQKARLVTDQKERINLLKKVIEFNPEDPSFYFNLSVCYENLEQLGLAKENIDLCMAKQRSKEEKNFDSDHVMQAIDVYAKLKDQETVNKYLGILRSINPNLYKLKKIDVRGYLK